MQQATAQPQPPLGALPPLVFHSTPNATVDSFTSSSAQSTLYSQASNDSLRDSGASGSSSDGEDHGFTPKQYRTSNSFNAPSRPHQLSISNGSGPAAFMDSNSFNSNQGYQTPTHQDIFGTRAPPSSRGYDFDIGPSMPGPTSPFMQQNGVPYQSMGQLQQQPGPIGKSPSATHMSQSMNTPHLMQLPPSANHRGSMNPLHGGPNNAAAGSLPSSGQFMSPTQIMPHQTLQHAASALGLQYGSPAFNDLVSKLARGDGANFQPTSMPQEEISTIFVVGFPDDMSVSVFFFLRQFHVFTRLS